MSVDSNCDFEKVPEHAAMKDPCSPEIEEYDFEWRGVKINMPEEVSIAGTGEPVLLAHEARMPVYILIQFTLDRLVKYELEREGVSLVFVNRDSGQSFVNNLGEPNPSLPRKKPEFSEEEMRSRVLRYYYNINALEFITLPDVRATYDVYATFEEFKSNVMTVKVK